MPSDTDHMPTNLLRNHAAFSGVNMEAKPSATGENPAADVFFAIVWDVV